MKAHKDQGQENFTNYLGERAMRFHNQTAGAAPLGHLNTKETTHVAQTNPYASKKKPTVEPQQQETH